MVFKVMLDIFQVQGINVSGYYAQKYISQCTINL